MTEDTLGYKCLGCGVSLVRRGRFCSKHKCLIAKATYHKHRQAGRSHDEALFYAKNPGMPGQSVTQRRLKYESKETILVSSEPVS